MENPWKDLPIEGEFVLPADKDKIDAYNNLLPSDSSFRIITDQLPGPYLGNPLKANVVILTLNPGFSKNDYEFHRSPDFSKDLKDNLEHKPIEFPFYYLNEKYKECGGYRYWYPFLEEAIKTIQGKVEDPVKTIANKVAVLEWFPYHSARFEWKFTLCGLESQKYSHWLAKECLSNPQKVIVIHRSYKLWEETLGPLDKCITHKSGRPTRIWYLTQNNLKDGDFERICEAILR